MDLSVVITARNEEFLQNTIDNVLENIRGETEIIVILDGYWPDKPISQNEKVTIIHHEESIGQRAAINEGVKLSEAKYMMKLDAHCTVDEGFDVKLMADCEHDWTVVPRMYNLHAFDWKCKRCGQQAYQGPKPKKCEKCGSQYFKKVMVWKHKTNPTSDYMLFDSDLKFGYWRGFKTRDAANGDITDLMSFIGACWFMEISRYWEIDGSDEAHGSWGQYGTEIACKSWLSGGRLVVNKKTWFSHMFRTGHGFGFPYKISGRRVQQTRKYSQEMWREGKWDKQVRPLSWLLDKFWPIPGWTSDQLVALKATNVISQMSKSTVSAINIVNKAPLKSPSKGMVYYTDNQCQERIATTVRNQLSAACNGHKIVSVSQYPLDFGKNIVMPIKRSVPSMFKQMLEGLKKIDTEIVFFVEHDVLYHPSHFDFMPLKENVYYYNDNVWALDAATGQALHYKEMKQVSGLVAYRKLLIEHYTKRVEKEGFSRRLGFEPGKKIRHGGIDDYAYEYFTSEHPIIDIKHGGTITPGRFKLDQYRCKSKIEDSWTLSDIIPYWGKTKGRFDEFLRGL